jgi:hypothetical protein
MPTHPCFAQAGGDLVRIQVGRRRLQKDHPDPFELDRNLAQNKEGKSDRHKRIEDWPSTKRRTMPVTGWQPNQTHLEQMPADHRLVECAPLRSRSAAMPLTTIPNAASNIMPWAETAADRKGAAPPG